MTARSPEAIENNQRTSREAKRRRRGICRVCGAETRYSGEPGKPVSDRCRLCANREVGDAMVGQGKLQLRALDFLSEPRRYIEIRDYLGISSDAISPFLDRALKRGLIERVSRGVYIRTDWEH